MTQLDYPRPAADWLEALPLGNGRLGAMCHGGEPAVFDLNEETIWSGHPGSQFDQWRAGPGAGPDAEATVRRRYDSARHAALDGDVERVRELIAANQTGYVQSFLPLGRLTISGGGPDGVRRLDLARAVHSTLTPGGEPATETFVSRTADVLVHHIAPSSPGQTTGGAEADAAGPRITVDFETPLRVLSEDRTATRIELRVEAPRDVAPGHEPGLPAATWPDPADAGTVQAALVVRWVSQDGGTGAQGATVVCAVRTTYPGLEAIEAGAADFRPWEVVLAEARADANAALATGYERLLADHTAAHARLYDRVELRLGAAPEAQASPAGASVEARLDAARRSADAVAHDPELIGVLFDYGRYLLISASRPGGLPATLQGIWNAEMQPPWSSAFTLNINTQMNYWPAHVLNLAETAEPLHRLIRVLAVTGRAASAELGANGWAAHHNTDAWGASHPVGAGRGDPSWAFWPMAAPWLVRHLAEHQAFGAAEHGFESTVLRPVARAAAESMLDRMVPLADGRWGTAPSTSPENTYLVNGSAAHTGVSSTMDIALARELFGLVAAWGPEADPLVQRSAEALQRLPEVGTRAAADGVMEWDRPVQEVDPQHRHVSHLYPLFPGDEADLPADGSFQRAARRTLERRGHESSGWSLAWKTALWARLREGRHVGELLGLFLRDARGLSGQWAAGLYPNLFAAHPPFQIDGNLGMPAAIAEALLQSHRRTPDLVRQIDLLPALPPQLADGRVRGLVARPGILVDIDWQGGALVRARLMRSAAAGRSTPTGSAPGAADESGAVFIELTAPVTGPAGPDGTSTTTAGRARVLCPPGRPVELSANDLAPVPSTGGRPTPAD
ncbi:glycosyl hydrolase family 95 catalytic domain-containing protein [Zhihengliuella halotolerans]|uniref:Alpha-L-fucosidase 2 n=1 Tax=Zhihengliuella halotolerans TaxID=370736 RepID=A0A4Q8AIN1_9MICC|nr:glycoside hydrolase N-terminal domain-containing protein [Zhihengliuella halotolerans]RZU63645.1 alpha-L-fucosidase 2 [Zhihengliuella halotolerans]